MQADAVDDVNGYDMIAAINWSTLSYLAVSPKLYRYRLDHPEEQKDAFRVGGAFHCAVLEPEKFDARYAVYDGPRAGEGSRTQHKAWRAEKAAARVIELSPEELAEVRAMADAVIGPKNGHRRARALLRGGRREEAVTWVDPITSLSCKGRLDYLRPDLVIDLKSSRRPQPTRFPRDAFDYGYVAQLAWYHDGAIAARLIDGRELPYIIAVENTAPYDVAVYRLTAETLAVGRSIYQRLMRRLVECIESDHWPGCAPDVVPLTLPQYAINQTLAAEHEEEIF
jgi:hypothetical protein